MFSNLKNNLKSIGSSLYECSIIYSTLKHSFASRILNTGEEMPEALSSKYFVRESSSPVCQRANRRYQNMQVALKENSTKKISI
jgi:hypothetical protein